MLKKMIFDKEAVLSMAEGILLVCQLLEKSYGPNGRSVVVENASQSVVITRNSQMILENLLCQDRYLNEGVQLVKEAIRTVYNQVGDGTKLTALLVKAMVEEGKKYLAAGIRPLYLRAGLKKALQTIEKQIASNTVIISDTKELIHSVKAACRDYDIASMAVNAYQKVSTKGVILVKASNRVENYMEVEEGMKIKQGYLSSAFCEKGKDRITYHHAYVLVTDMNIASFSTLLPILEQIVKEARPLLIISEDITKEALAMLLHNVSHGVFKIAAVKAEGYKKRKSDLLEDIAVLTGTKVLKQDCGDEIETCTLSLLGQAEEVVVTKNFTTIYGGKGEAWKIKNQIKEIQKIMEDQKTNEYDKEQYRERMGRLKNGVAVLYVGGRTNQEIRESKQGMESAVRVARNIIEGGMLPGGGSFLYHMAEQLDQLALSEEEEYGKRLLQLACTAPLKTLLLNNGKDLGKLVELHRSNSRIYSMGYNTENDKIEDMYREGVMDSATVILMALEQAVSVVSEWLDCAVLMISTGPDREDLQLMKEGVPIMW